MIRNKRADSLKEAINIYEQDMRNLQLSNQLSSLSNEIGNVSEEVRDLRYETSYQGRMQQDSIREIERKLKR